MVLGITDNLYPQYVPKQPRTAYLNSTVRWDYETYHPTALVTGIPSLLRSGPQCFARQISVRRFDNRRSRRNNIPATRTFVSTNVEFKTRVPLDCASSTEAMKTPPWFSSNWHASNFASCTPRFFPIKLGILIVLAPFNDNSGYPNILNNVRAIHPFLLSTDCNHRLIRTRR